MKPCALAPLVFFIVAALCGPAAANRRPFVEAKDPGCTTAATCQARCDKGTFAACRQLGNWYADGDGVPSDAKRGHSLLQKACSGGDGRACTDAGALLATGPAGVAVDAAAAAALFKQACDARDVYGCAQLGRAMTQGEGIAKDVKAAAALLDATCLPTFAPGCSAAGDALHALGRFRESAARFEQACKGGVLSACVNLGAQLESGEGVPVDTQRAAALFTQACKGGLAIGCTNASTMKPSAKP